jgi:sugar/nucleoside kinase (ribokinase family)
MTLIDESQAAALYEKMGPGIECSGGSAANTVAGIAALGGRAAFVGKVRDDPLGQVFVHDLRAIGIEFDTRPAEKGVSTARCLVLVTPDAQRTMSTFLGASVALGPDDVDEGQVARAQVTYLEGYLWDPAQAKDAFRKAMKVAHEAGRKIALTLSDAFCVDRYRREFIDLAQHQVDILFANEVEITSLYQTADFDAALQQVRGHCEVAVLTRGDKGSVIVSGDEVHIIDPEPLPNLVDTTGAGDLYAAGFLSGLTQGRILHECGRMGSIAAAEVISHFGARPEADLKALISDKLGN